MKKIAFIIMCLVVLSLPVLAGWPHGGDGENAYCTACHSAHEATESALLRAGTAVCCSCHAYQEPAGLWPGIDVYEQSAHIGLCTDCHNPHGVTDSGGRISHLAVRRGADLCLGCHLEVTDDFTESMDFEQQTATPSRHHVDQASSGVACVDCHNPHVVEKGRGGYEARVTNPTNPLHKIALQNRVVINKFCIACHNGSREQAPNILNEINETSISSGFITLTKQESLHAVHLTKTHKQHCLQCHEPHANTGNQGVNRGRLLHNLTVNYYNQGYPGYNSCDTSCHGVRCGSCHPLPPFTQSN